MNLIKQIRTKKGVTQSQLAEQLGYTRTMVAKWENGHVMPSEVQLKEIAKFFDIDPLLLMDANQTEKVEMNTVKEIKTKEFVAKVAAIESTVYLIVVVALAITNYFVNSEALKIALIALTVIGLIGILFAFYKLYTFKVKLASSKGVQLEFLKKHLDSDKFKDVKEMTEKEIETIFNREVIKQASNK